MTTRKSVLVLLAAVLIIALVAGCSQPASEAGGEGNGEQPLNLVFAGANPSGGGTWDLIGSGIAESIRRGVPNSVITFVPGEGTANPVTVSKGEAELGFAQSVVAVAATKGNEPYDQEYSNLRAIGAFYSSVEQFVVTKDSGIESIQQIIDNKMPVRIAVDNPGSTQEMTNKRLLEEYGVTYEDIESWGGQVVYKGFSDASGMMNEGLVDVMSTLTIVPAGAVQEAANTKEIKMLPVDPKVVEAMCQKYGYAPEDIPASSYSFMENDLTSFATKVNLLVSTDMSEEDAYRITKALVENLDYLKTVHSNVQNLTAEEMAAGTGIALHPGAEKYYREIGAIQ